MNPEPQNQQETTLESWKEIAAYLQRDAKTARRWEKEEGLPVHRHSHNSRSSVYAYASEIDTWRLSRKTTPEPAPAPIRTLWRIPTFALAILLCLVMVGNGIRPQAASAKSGPLAKRLVCANCGNFEGDLSRDGRWMVFPDWVRGDLAIRDLSTDQVTRLVKGDPSGAHAESPVLSPDRRQILYDWDPEKGASQLMLISNQPGSNPRVLMENPDNAFYEPAAWFPDGKSALMIVYKRDKTTQFARVSVSDGSVKVLKALDLRLSGGEADSRPRLSPDGQYIVYSARAVNPSRIPPATSDPKDQHIYILAADGSRENEVVKTAGINKNAVWTPDGKHILFISDRSGKFGLWSIDVQEGKATGAASLVSADIGSVVGVGMAHGSYYYFVNALQGEYVHMVEVTLGGSAPAADAFSGIRPTWSPDGKSVAFKRHHPGSDGYDVVIHSLETGEEKTPLAGIGITGNGRPMWSHDGMSIMTGVKRGDGPSALTRVDLKTGEFKELHTILGVSALSLDGKTLYVAPESTPSRIVATDLDTGQERVVLASLPTRASIALSPDGRTLAIGWTERPAEGAKLRIARISVDGSGYRDLYTRTRTDHLRGAGTVVWDRDGRSILFDQQQPGEGGRWGVMRVPAEGGPATLVFATPGPMQSFDVSPDGSRFAYSANESANELWALDNVLTMLK